MLLAKTNFKKNAHFILEYLNKSKFRAELWKKTKKEKRQSNQPKALINVTPMWLLPQTAGRACGWQMMGSAGRNVRSTRVRCGLWEDTWAPSHPADV